MKIYAVKSMSWIEDYYWVYETYDDGLFANKEDAINFIESIPYDQDDTAIIKYMKDDVQYWIVYNSYWFDAIDTLNDDIEGLFYQTERSQWCYIAELEVK